MPSSSLAAIVSEIEWMDGWGYRWAVEFPGLPFSLIVPSTAIVKISVECTWEQILLLVFFEDFWELQTILNLIALESAEELNGNPGMGQVSICSVFICRSSCLVHEKSINL